MLVWWGHVAHDQVSDAVVDRVQHAVLGGMGLVVLHSGHFSQHFRRLMGTSCSLQWREAGEHERLWNLRPDHPGAGAASPTTSSWPRRRCTASASTSRTPTSC